MEEFARWLLDALLWLPRQLFALLLDGLVAVIAAIPVPDWVHYLDLGSAAAVMGWAFGVIRLKEGVAIVLGAYFIRFAIRRLPWFG